MLALLALITALLIGTGLKVIEHRLSRRKPVTPEPLRNVILPSELKQEDFDWFCWSMEMAGLDPKRVVNTCSCGFAQECYMHCNHQLNDGKCTGHAWKKMSSQWGGKFQAIAVQQPELLSWQRERTLSDNQINAFKQKMIDNRNAKMKAEFESSGTDQTIEALRKRIDEREIKLRKYEARIERLARDIEPARPQYISSPVYSPRDDAYTVYGRKVSRQMMEDLIYNGYMTPQQLREIIAPEIEYETVYTGDGTCYPVRVR